MNRNRATSFVWWLLPFLAARALVPAGFMADVASGDFRLVMCSQVVNVATTEQDVSVVSRFDNDRQSGSEQGDSHSSSHAPCLFAASATATLATVDDAIRLNDPHHARLITTSVVSFLVRDGKVQPIRGPPVFS